MRSCSRGRCLAIEALDELGEDGDAFRDILRSLAGRPEPMVRLRAAPRVED